ncbi:MAG: sigma-70 family RNA polymerase sigma factor [Verrucomicrobia bacterium]|nr:sigma-70 family RNA polymerase sigma factor [Verrucomicrobiota bacterium]
MTSESPTTPPPREPPGATFRTTRWTTVSRAKADSEEGREALADLCKAYYEPVAAFLRCEFRDADSAREMAHEFFARLLAGDAIATADRERGRFRSYLLGAVKHFLSQRRRATRRLKRGGEAECVSLDDRDAAVARSVADAGLTPDAAFDRQWALTVMARAFEALRLECAAEGRKAFFHRVKPWLTGEAAHGDQAAVAAECGMNAAALKVAVHRMKKRFRQAVKAEVTGTLDDPAKVEAEMRALLTALGR